MKIIGLVGTLLGAFVLFLLILFIFCCVIIGRDKWVKKKY